MSKDYSLNPAGAKGVRQRFDETCQGFDMFAYVDVRRELEDFS